MSTVEDGAADVPTVDDAVEPPPAEPSTAPSTSNPTRRGKSRERAERAEVKNHFEDVLPSAPPSAPPSPVLSRSSFRLTHLPRPLTSTSTSTSPPAVAPKEVTLSAASTDLKSLALSFARLVPFFPKGHPVRTWSKRFFAPPFRKLLDIMARVFHRRGIMPGDLMYDLLVLLFKWIVRSERLPRRRLSLTPLRSTSSSARSSREALTISLGQVPSSLSLRRITIRCAPRTLFAQGAPLTPSQFLDPLNLMAETRLNAGRRISFIAAEKSVQRAFVGLMIRLMQSSACSLFGF